MAATVVYNKLGGDVLLLVTANATVNVAGNTGSSDIAVSGTDENVISASIKCIVCGTPEGNSAYWEVFRNTTRVGIYGGTMMIDYFQNGMTLSANGTATFVANLNNTVAGSLLVLLKKTSRWTSDYIVH